MPSRSAESRPQRIRRLILRQLERAPEGLTDDWLMGAVCSNVFRRAEIDRALKTLVAGGTVERVEVMAPLRHGMRPTHRFTLYRLVR